MAIAAVLLAPVLAGGCAAGVHVGEGFPKFRDIPLKPAATTAPSEAKSQTAVLQGMAAKLADQEAGLSDTANSRDALIAARDAANQIQPSTDADAAATEAFARAARARATPPPVRKSK